MKKWYQIEIHGNNIEAGTGRADLIKMKSNSNYSGYKFWHPAKLVRSKKGNYTFSFTEDFTFKLFKNGNGKWNKYDKIDEVEIGFEEMINEWGLDLSDFEEEVEEKESYVEVVEPEKVDKEVEVIKELVNE